MWDLVYFGLLWFVTSRYHPHSLTPHLLGRGFQTLIDVGSHYRPLLRAPSSHKQLVDIIYFNPLVSYSASQF